MDQPPTPVEPAASEQAPGQAPEPAKPSGPKIYQTQDFWIGVAIFVVLNVILFGVATTFQRASQAIGIVALILNLALMILFARVRSRIAAGMLATLAFLLVIGLPCYILIGTCFSGLQ